MLPFLFSVLTPEAALRAHWEDRVSSGNALPQGILRCVGMVTALGSGPRALLQSLCEQLGPVRVIGLPHPASWAAPGVPRLYPDLPGDTSSPACALQIFDGHRLALLSLESFHRVSGPLASEALILSSLCPSLGRSHQQDSAPENIAFSLHHPQQPPGEGWFWAVWLLCPWGRHLGGGGGWGRA